MTGIDPAVLRIEGGHLVEITDKCTCGGSPVEGGPQHEPGCGMEPLMTVVELAALVARDHDRYVQGLRQQLEDTKGAVITRHREADLLRGQLFDLCEWVGVDPGEDPHGALLAHLRGREGSP